MKRMPGTQKLILTVYCFGLWCGALASAQDKPLAIIEGTVVHAISKEPVRKAHVTLELAQGEHDSTLVATSSDTGTFRFVDIPAGVYKLTVEKKGFLDGVYGATNLDDQGSLLKIADGDRQSGLTLLLFPGGSISGRVLDSDGDPQPGSEVTLWVRQPERYKGGNSHTDETKADQSGEYHFTGLSPGTYYTSATLGAMGEVIKQMPVDQFGKVTKLHDLQTFYPAALSLAEAQAIPIESGREQSAMDIHLQRGITLNVKGRIAGHVSLPSTYSVGASIEDGVSSSYESGNLLPDGEFIVKDLPPGPHRLRLMNHGPNGYQTIGETDITLSGQDLTGVVITPFKPAIVHVRVVMEGTEDKPLTAGSVYLNRMRDGGKIEFTENQYEARNGTYTFDNVTPGKYWIGFNNSEELYLKSLQSAGQSLDPESVEVGDGAVQDLLMIFSRNVATLNGDVQLPDNQSSHSVHVLLISEKPGELDFLRFRYPDLDQAFHFVSPHLAPGKYLAFAAEDNDPDVWDQAAFVNVLQDKSMELDLHEKEHASIRLKLITKDETDRIRKQLGI